MWEGRVGGVGWERVGGVGWKGVGGVGWEGVGCGMGEGRVWDGRG